MIQVSIEFDFRDKTKTWYKQLLHVSNGTWRVKRYVSQAEPGATEFEAKLIVKSCSETGIIQSSWMIMTTGIRLV